MFLNWCPIIVLDVSKHVARIAEYRHRNIPVIDTKFKEVILEQLYVGIADLGTI